MTRGGLMSLAETSCMLPYWETACELRAVCAAVVLLDQQMSNIIV